MMADPRDKPALRPDDRWLLALLIQRTQANRNRPVSFYPGELSRIAKMTDRAVDRALCRLEKARAISRDGESITVHSATSVTVSGVKIGKCRITESWTRIVRARGR